MGEPNPNEAKVGDAYAREAHKRRRMEAPRREPADALKREGSGWAAERHHRARAPLDVPIAVRVAAVVGPSAVGASGLDPIGVDARLIADPRRSRSDHSKRLARLRPRAVCSYFLFALDTY